MAKLTIFSCFLLLACTSQALPPPKLQLSLAKGDSNIDILLNDTLSQIEKVTEGAFGNLDSLKEENENAVMEKMQNVQSTVNTILNDVGITINELIQFIEALGDIYDAEKNNTVNSSVSEDNEASKVSQDEAPEVSEDEDVEATEPSVSEDEAPEVSKDEAPEVSKDEDVDATEPSVSEDNKASEISQDQDVGAAKSCGTESNEDSAVSEDEDLDTAESSNIMKPSIVPWPYTLVYYPVPVVPWPYMLQQYPPPSEMKAPSYPWQYVQPLSPPQGKMDPPSLLKTESP
ncbi:uncharacterized protein LOC107274392 isoform X2 [Cephus cinctus]|uniref:Uncharacterized protein LOC107274392 isoform X2 n=1 Tax=Cephus cinctus TaxID=211228 RepID=A0AAJ7FUH9_CEPCN|nr:uncharacterized protein LOC107274392 isoform X2 [Cephus cinctus]